MCKSAEGKHHKHHSVALPSPPLNRPASLFKTPSSKLLFFRKPLQAVHVFSCCHVSFAQVRHDFDLQMIRCVRPSSHQLTCQCRILKPQACSECDSLRVFALHDETTQIKSAAVMAEDEICGPFRDDSDDLVQVLHRDGAG